MCVNKSTVSCIYSGIKDLFQVMRKIAMFSGRSRFRGGGCVLMHICVSLLRRVHCGYVPLHITVYTAPKSVFISGWSRRRRGQMEHLQIVQRGTLHGCQLSLNKGCRLSIRGGLVSRTALTHQRPPPQPPRALLFARDSNYKSYRGP